MTRMIAMILCGLTSMAALAADPVPRARGVRSVSKFSPDRLAHDFIAVREQDPIGFLAVDMSEATDLLAQLNTSIPVQPQQEKLLGRLDELIARLQKQCNGAGSSANPTKPMADSRIAKGPGGSGPLHDPKSGTRSWGQLPPRQREQILQSQNEGFPPGYESILASYYKRLAQENVNDGGAVSPASDQPSTQPSR